MKEFIIEVAKVGKVNLLDTEQFNRALNILKEETDWTVKIRSCIQLCINLQDAITRLASEVSEDDEDEKDEVSVKAIENAVKKALEELPESTKKAVISKLENADMGALYSKEQASTGKSQVFLPMHDTFEEKGFSPAGFSPRTKKVVIIDADVKKSEKSIDDFVKGVLKGEVVTPLAESKKVLLRELLKAKGGQQTLE